MKNRGPVPKPAPDSPTGVVVWLTLTGSWALASVAYFLHHPDLVLGALVGGPFAILHHLGLRVLAARLLNMGNMGKGPFWTWSLLRYGIAAVVFGVLVQVSVLCLLGTLALYVWSLGVLFWTGMKIPATQKNS